MSVKIIIFFLSYVWVAQMKCLIEKVILSTQNISFEREIGKLFFNKSLAASKAFSIPPTTVCSSLNSINTVIDQKIMLL